MVMSVLRKVYAQTFTSLQDPARAEATFRVMSAEGCRVHTAAVANGGFHILWEKEIEDNDRVSDCGPYCTREPTRGDAGRDEALDYRGPEQPVRTPDTGLPPYFGGAVSDGVLPAWW